MFLLISFINQKQTPIIYFCVFLCFSKKNEQKIKYVIFVFLINFAFKNINNGKPTSLSILFFLSLYNFPFTAVKKVMLNLKKNLYKYIENPNNLLF